MKIDLSPQITKETEAMNQLTKKYNRAAKAWMCVGVAALAFQAYVTVKMIQESHTY